MSARTGSAGRLGDVASVPIMLKKLIQQLVRRRTTAPRRAPAGAVALVESPKDLAAWLELDANELAASTDALMSFGEGLLTQDRIGDALRLFHRAAASDHPRLSILQRLGDLLEQVGDLDTADEHSRRALELFPKDPRLLFTHANVLGDLGHWEEARDRYEEALTIAPQFADAHFNFGVLLTETGSLSEAIEKYEAVLALQPDYFNAHLNIALVRLASGDLERGWREFQIRFDPRLGADAVKARALQIPEWHGEDLHRSRILVSGEQGLGDQMLFASMYPELIASAAGCVFECTRKLVPLFAHSFPEATVVSITEPPDTRTIQDIQYRISAGSLARWLRPTIDSFPPSTGYLSAVPERIEYWRNWLSSLGAGLKVGICWRSSNTKGQRALACTDLMQWANVFGVKDVCFVNLQYDECSAELARVERQFGVRVSQAPGVDLFNDLLEASALMRPLDLVITAPTLVSVHAAALGVPTWQLSCGLDWQVLGTTYNPWLPALTRYFRRPDQSWDEILDVVASDLERRAARNGK